MRDEDNRRRERLPGARDRQMRRAVLNHVLERHPTNLRVAELALEFTAGEQERFEASDAVERAVRDLTGAGLVHCAGGAVAPTNAALCFASLLAPTNAALCFASLCEADGVD